MKATVYGRSLILADDEHIAAVNLGYNVCAEHKEGTIGLVNYLNRQSGNNKIAQVPKQYRDTAFEQAILTSSTNLCVRKITVKHDEEDKWYCHFLFSEGKWVTLQFYKQSTALNQSEKRIFAEHDLLHMEDYQGTRDFEPLNIVAKWASDGFALFLPREFPYRGRVVHGDVLLGNLERAIRSKTVAVLPEFSRLFPCSRGCILLDLEQLKTKG